MKKVLLAVVVTLVLIASMSFSAMATVDKYYVCHAAGQSGTSKFVYLELPYNATFGQAGHFYENGTPRSGHEDDFITVKNDKDCNGVVDPTNTPTPVENSKTPTPVENSKTPTPENEENTPTPVGENTPTPVDNTPTPHETEQPRYPDKPRPTPCPLCGTSRVDEEGVCSGSVGKNMNSIFNIFGKGNLYHTWSNAINFYAVNRITGEQIVSIPRNTPAGIIYVFDTDWLWYDIYDANGNAVDDICYHEPCSVAGWSYVDGTGIQPDWAFTVSDMQIWFETDPLFVTFGAGEEAHQLAVLAMNDLRKGIVFDLAPYLK